MDDPPSITEEMFAKLPAAALQSLAKSWGLSGPNVKKVKLLPVVKALRIAVLGPFPKPQSINKHRDFRGWLPN